MNIPYTMVRALTASGREIPLTVTDRFREGNRPGDALCEEGFEFETLGFMFWEPGWRPVTCLAIARGKMEYLKGTLCEAYEPVREHWLAEIERLIQCGADRLDIRLQNHSSTMSDYPEFGYNEPLVRAYRDRHGIDIRETPADPLALMRLRGDFFLDFVAAARSALHASGRFLQLHMRHCLQEPRLCADHNQLGFWAMPKILPDWRRMVELADEVTIKDYGFGVYDPTKAARIRAEAAAAGKPVWAHCYLQQGGDLNPQFCTTAQADETLHGLVLYELAYRPEDEGNTAHGLVGVDDQGSRIVNEDTLNRLRELTTYG